MKPKNLNNPEEIMAYVHWFLKKYKNIPKHELDDFASECYVRIYQVLPQFDAKRGKLSTFLFYACQSTTNYQVSKMKRIRNQAELMGDRGDSLEISKKWKSPEQPKEKSDLQMDNITTELMEVPLF